MAQQNITPAMVLMENQTNSRAQPINIGPRGTGKWRRNVYHVHGIILDTSEQKLQTQTPTPLRKEM